MEDDFIDCPYCGNEISVEDISLADDNGEQFVTCDNCKGKSLINKEYSIQYSLSVVHGVSCFLCGKKGILEEDGNKFSTIIANSNTRLSSEELLYEIKIPENTKVCLCKDCLKYLKNV